MAQAIETFRGREIYVHDGYMYIFDAFSANKLKKFWRCRYKDSCKARIHTIVETNKFLKRVNEHSTHDSEAAKIEANSAVTKMKKRARETMEPTSNIINECTSELSQAGKVNIKILITSIEN